MAGVPAASPWPLYPSGVAPLDRPGYFSPESVKNRPEGRVFFNVTNVTLTPYLVDRGHPLFTGASVIVAPGGAYKWITWDAEGTDIAAWLNSIGVSAFVLKYRVPFRPWLEPGALSCCPATPSCCAPPDRLPNYTDVRAARGPLIDAQRALSVVRARAPALGLNATAVGFMGFSAGGHLGAQLGTTGLRRRLYARVDSADDATWRAPDWLILVYPAYLVPSGRDVTPSDRAVTLNVTAEHPPTLLLQSEDGGFSYGSIYYYLALKAAAATASDAYAAHAHELHQYPDRTEQAKHGFGRCLRPPVASDVCAWPDNARAFMQGLGVAARRLAPRASVASTSLRGRATV